MPYVLASKGLEYKPPRYGHVDVHGVTVGTVAFYYARVNWGEGGGHPPQRHALAWTLPPMGPYNQAIREVSHGTKTTRRGGDES